MKMALSLAFFLFPIIASAGTFYICTNRDGYTSSVFREDFSGPHYVDDISRSRYRDLGYDCYRASKSVSQEESIRSMQPLPDPKEFSFEDAQ